MKISIQPIQAQHNNKICEIIKSVGAEYGAVGDGFGPSDPEVEAMSDFYNAQNNSQYFVVMVNEQIVGGAGIAAFNDSKQVCELRKLFLLSTTRGLGLGKKLTQTCLDYAKDSGYSECYLDTLSNMKAAIALYEKMGFEHLDKPLQGTIHGGCDIWMLKSL
ncbi:N-acetyltransferase [Psychromonas marina]|uniref:N-acetyltransferase n=1 Tax=Psychromonas marina TaxID=88364 RepID=A0ABQ6E2H6_9GAMM|nr:GNAT family N-acetyltransferase [Psychromonas marina]GLS91378.1 N-acetyltransferase [Psychromonas marina]